MIQPKIRSNLLYGLIALVFALILFFNANGRGLGSPLTGGVTPEAYEETVSNVRIEPVYDNTKYYIHGFNSTVSVKLKSVNRIQLNTEANADTRGFRVIADLTGLGEGNHEVKLQLQNMSSAVEGTIEPTTITVTIESRASAKMKVEPGVSTTNLAEGFAIDKVAVDPEEVTVTTGSQTLSEIHRLVATVDPAKITDHNTEEKARVQALDQEGNVLSAEIDPAEVTVKVTLTAPQKQVGLYTEQTGTPASGVAGYRIELASNSAIISGKQSALDELETLSVPVDISGISQKTTRKVHIPVPDGLAVEPTEVAVTITPQMNTTTTQNSSSQQNTGNTQQSSTSEAGTSEEKSTSDESSSTSDDTSSSDAEKTTETSNEEKPTESKEKNETAVDSTTLSETATDAQVAMR